MAKEFSISLLHNSTSVFSYTFSSAYTYALVFAESDYTNTGSLSLTSSTGSYEQLMYMHHYNSSDYVYSEGGHSGRTYLLKNISSGDKVVFSSSKSSAIHIYSLSSTIKSELTVTTLGRLTSNSDTSDTTRTYTADKYYDAIFIHTIMGENDEMNQNDWYSSNVTATWTRFSHTGHDGGTTGAMGSGYLAKAAQGASVSVTTQNHPWSGAEECNSRSYWVFGLNIGNSTSIYKGNTQISEVYYRNKSLDHVYYRGYDLVSGGYAPIPITFDYEYSGSYSEVDILYTTDTHLRWKGNAGSDYKYSPVFSLQDIADYKDKLWDNGIPAFCVDCGDWVHGPTTTSSLQNSIINFFNNCGSKGLTKYLAVTYGNHEWYEAVGSTAEQCKAYLDRVDNMTACNFLKDGETVYRPYRAIKVGDKKIGIIGVGYPSPNGRDGTTAAVRSFGGYTFYDSQQTTDLNPKSALYVQVQGIIDGMKANDFDYIIAITHMDRYTDENFSDDGRFNSRAEFLGQNTDGLQLIIPGHKNYEVTTTTAYTGINGTAGKVVQEAGCSTHSFGRIKLKFDGTAPESYLLTSQSDLEVI